MTSGNPRPEPVEGLTVSLEVPESEASALQDWLLHEPSLRPYVKRVPAPERPGTMGAWADLVVALGSSGVAIELARSLQTWLSQRRSDVSVSIVASDGNRIEVSVSNSPDAAKIVDLARSALPADGSASKPG